MGLNQNTVFNSSMNKISKVCFWDYMSQVRV